MPRQYAINYNYILSNLRQYLNFYISSNKLDIFIIFHPCNTFLVYTQILLRTGRLSELLLLFALDIYSISIRYVKLFPSILSFTKSPRNQTYLSSQFHYATASYKNQYLFFIHNIPTIPLFATAGAATGRPRLHDLPKSIRSLWIKHLVACHHRHQIFRLRQINNVVCPSGDHVDRFDLLSRNLELNHLSSVSVPLLDQAMAGNDDKQLPLGVVPVLSFGDARLADVDRYLAAVLRV